MGHLEKPRGIGSVVISCPDGGAGGGEGPAAGLVRPGGRLVILAAKDDPLAKLAGLIDFELFRPTPEAALPRAAYVKLAVASARRLAL